MTSATQQPGHGDHTASLRLEKTGAFEACLSANGTSFAQKELAHWIEDWHHCITGIDSNGEDLTAKQLANAVRKIEIKATQERSHEEGDWNTKRSGMDALDASAGAATPDIIRFHCIPYEGLAYRTFEMRVSILTDDIKPNLKLRIIGLETAQEEMAKEFKLVLADELEENTTLLLGSFSKLTTNPLRTTHHPAATHHQRRGSNLNRRAHQCMHTCYLHIRFSKNGQSKTVLEPFGFD